MMGLDEIQTTAVSHLDLLSRMDGLSDDIYSAIQSGDMDTVNSLLEARSVLLRQIDDSSRILNESLAWMKDENNAVLDSSISKSILAHLDRADRLQTALLKKQTSCEYALGRKIEESKADLASVRMRKGLGNAYKTPNGSNPARFLDNKS